MHRITFALEETDTKGRFIAHIEGHIEGQALTAKITFSKSESHFGHCRLYRCR